MAKLTSSTGSIFKVFAIVGLGSTLAACGGGGGAVDAPPAPDNTPNIDPQDTARTFSAASGDFGTVIAADGTLTARQAAQVAVLLDQTLGTTESSDSTVAIKRNDGGAITLVVNGVEHEFDVNPDEGGDQFLVGEFGENNRSANVFLSEATLTEILTAGNGNSQVFSYETFLVTDSDTQSIRGYAVVGTETADEDVGTLSEASYSGKARMDLFPTTGFVDSSASRSSLRGDTTMTVNLDSTEISGLIDNMSFEPPGEDRVEIAGSVLMGSSQFDVNAFGGSLTADADLVESVDLITDADVGEYNGAFFGASGEEVGGSLSYEGDSVIGAGFFFGEQTPEAPE